MFKQGCFYVNNIGCRFADYSSQYSFSALQTLTERRLVAGARTGNNQSRIFAHFKL